MPAPSLARIEWIPRRDRAGHLTVVAASCGNRESGPKLRCVVCRSTHAPCPWRAEAMTMNVLEVHIDMGIQQMSRHREGIGGNNQRRPYRGVDDEGNAPACRCNRAPPGRTQHTTRGVRSPSGSAAACSFQSTHGHMLQSPTTTTKIDVDTENVVPTSRSAHDASRCDSTKQTVVVHTHDEGRTPRRQRHAKRAPNNNNQVSIHLLNGARHQQHATKVTYQMRDITILRRERQRGPPFTIVSRAMVTVVSSIAARARCELLGMRMPRQDDERYVAWSAG